MNEQKQNLWSMAKRALRLLCPNCGEGKLFKSYLKPVDKCTSCHEEFGHIRADDGPAWLTILVVGHIIVPIALYVESNYYLENWQSMTIWPILILAMILAVLPSAKGVFITMIWRHGCVGSEK